MSYDIGLCEPCTVFAKISEILLHNNPRWWVSSINSTDTSIDTRLGYRTPTKLVEKIGIQVEKNKKGK